MTNIDDISSSVTRKCYQNSNFIFWRAVKGYACI